MKDENVEAMVALGAWSRSRGGRVDRDGRSFRRRRGEWVEIPEQWVGKVAFPQQLRRRQRAVEYGDSRCGRVPRDRQCPEKEWRKWWLRAGHPRTWAPRKARNRFDRRVGYEDTSR